MKKLSLLCAAVFSLSITMTVNAAPITYVLVAEPTDNGSTLTGTFVWDSSITSPTLANVSGVTMHFTPGPSIDGLINEVDGIAVWSDLDNMYFTGSVGDAELVQNYAWAAATQVTFAVREIAFIVLGVDIYALEHQKHSLWSPHRYPAASYSDYSNGDIDGPQPDWKLVREDLVVPVPAAFWLFGSGLLGLIGVARRKNA